jgi:hypothetical protein
MANTILGETRPAQISIRSNGGIPLLDETYHFLVRAESKNTSRLLVVTTPGLPVVGVTVSSFGFSVCKSKVAVRRENQADLWDVTCEFSSEVDEKQSNQDPSSDPSTWVPIYETKFERVQMVVTRDYAGTAIANSAGQPFPNGMTITRKLPQWEFYQFEPASVSDETVIARSETTNSGAFKGRPARTLLCVVLSSQLGFYYGTRLRFTRYSLTYDVLKWTHKRLDVGTVYLSGSDHLPYLDDSGNVMEGGLNGSGAKVTVGDPPSILEFDMYNAIDFSTFLRV